MPLHKEMELGRWHSEQHNAVKVHISATIDPDIALAIGKYRDDPANLINNEKPARSKIIQDALKKYLHKYMQKNQNQ